MNPLNYIQQNRAAIFDYSVISISFMLGFIFHSFGEFVKSPSFYWWMFVALMLYTVGAALKHLPLSYRLSHASYDPRPVPYILFLVIGHWMIFIFLIILCEAVFRKILHLPPLTDKNSGSWQIVNAGWIGATIITWLVYRTKSKRKSKKIYSSLFLSVMEIVADTFLIAGVSILTFVLWEKGVMGMLSRAKTDSIGDIWFLFVFLSILFLFCYLPLRYLYFVEDKKAGANRRRLLLIFIFILLRALFQMLNI